MVCLNCSGKGESKGKNIDGYFAICSRLWAWWFGSSRTNHSCTNSNCDHPCSEYIGSFRVGFACSQSAAFGWSRRHNPMPTPHDSRNFAARWIHNCSISDFDITTSTGARHARISTATSAMFDLCSESSRWKGKGRRASMVDTLSCGEHVSQVLAGRKVDVYTTMRHSVAKYPATFGWPKKVPHNLVATELHKNVPRTPSLTSYAERVKLRLSSIKSTWTPGNMSLEVQQPSNQVCLSENTHGSIFFWLFPFLQMKHGLFNHCHLLSEIHVSPSVVASVSLSHPFWIIELLPLPFTISLFIPSTSTRPFFLLRILITRWQGFSCC